MKPWKRKKWIGFFERWRWCNCHTLLDGNRQILRFHNNMQRITFITGNAKKAEYLSKYLQYPTVHVQIDLDEIQSLDLFEIVEHKVKQAYDRVQWPVLVEDVSLSLSALGRLPWPFIKFFEKEVWLDWLINLAWDSDRSAEAICVFWFYDGNNFQAFEWTVRWSISKELRWKWGYGWDRIFIPYFTEKTAAELNEIEYERFYTEEKPFEKLRNFLNSLDS